MDDQEWFKTGLQNPLLSYYAAISYNVIGIEWYSGRTLTPKAFIVILFIAKIRVEEYYGKKKSKSDILSFTGAPETFAQTFIKIRWAKFQVC